jgi:hypothetical protein
MGASYGQRIMMRASSGGVANEDCSSSIGAESTGLTGKHRTATSTRIVSLPAKAQRRKVSFGFMFALRLRAFAETNSEKDPDTELNVTWLVGL